MSRWASSSGFMDIPLNFLKNNVTIITATTAQPTTFAQAFTIAGSGGYMKVKSTGLTSTSFAGPANSASTGRKIEIKSLTGLTPSSSGTVNHIALCSGASSALLYVTVCGTKSLTTTDTVTFSSWGIHIIDPTSD